MDIIYLGPHLHTVSVFFQPLFPGSDPETSSSMRRGVFLVLFFIYVFLMFFLIFLVLGLQEGRKQGRKQQPGRIGRKEGGREGSTEGGQEGGKEGTVFLFTSALETLAATVLLLNPEPKNPKPPNALKTVRPYDPKALKP